MGGMIGRDIGTEKRLDALDKAGLKDDILAMQKLDLTDPAQAVQAQEKLDALLPKMNKAFKDLTHIDNEMSVLRYKDPTSGETIQSGEPVSGGIATLNDAIRGFEKQNASAQPAPTQQAPQGAAPAAPNQP